MQIIHTRQILKYMQIIQKYLGHVINYVIEFNVCNAGLKGHKVTAKLENPLVHIIYAVHTSSRLSMMTCMTCHKRLELG